MSVIQFMVVVVWAVVTLYLTIASGVGAGIQGVGLSKDEWTPYFGVTVLFGILSAAVGIPIFLWIF